MRVKAMKPLTILGAAFALASLAWPARSQVVTEFWVPTSDSDPLEIAAGPGGMWFTEHAANRIGLITPDGRVSELPVPRSPNGIVAGPDGNLWFTETNANKVGRITPSGVITEFMVSGNPRGIAAGLDGNLWFAEYGGNKIGRISIGGQLTEFPIPTPNAQPWGISAGPDGNIWLTERGADQIGRITLGSDADVLRLDGDRFLVTVAWQSPAGSGSGHPVSLTPQAGYFWFADPANVEIVVKILDWCPAGGVKFFAAGLTNFRVEIDVTDTQTGFTKHYSNPQDVAFQAVEDDFSTCTTGPPVGVAGTWTGTYVSTDWLDCDTSIVFPALRNSYGTNSVNGTSTGRRRGV
jgi:hypothetical protein